jgi:hypothetical protein
MKWTIERVVLAISTLIFIGFGTWLFATPEALSGIGIQLTEPAARIDIRATYGGMELGLSAFLIMCLLRDDWVRIGLVAAGCTIAGFGITRLLAIALEGEGTPLMWSFVAIELVAAVVIALVLRRGGEAGSDNS